VSVQKSSFGGMMFRVGRLVWIKKIIMFASFMLPRVNGLSACTATVFTILRHKAKFR